MIGTCVRCDTPAAAVMAFDYPDAEVWIEDIGLDRGNGYLLCALHADRLTPPLGWRLADRRTTVRLFAPLEVA